jgi:hypothetical protein
MALQCSFFTPGLTSPFHWVCARTRKHVRAGGGPGRRRVYWNAWVRTCLSLSDIPQVDDLVPCCADSADTLSGTRERLSTVLVTGHVSPLYFLLNTFTLVPTSNHTKLSIGCFEHAILLTLPCPLDGELEWNMHGRLRTSHELSASGVCLQVLPHKGVRGAVRGSAPVLMTWNEARTWPPESPSSLQSRAVDRDESPNDQLTICQMANAICHKPSHLYKL